MYSVCFFPSHFLFLGRSGNSNFFLLFLKPLFLEQMSYTFNGIFYGHNFALIKNIHCLLGELIFISKCIVKIFFCCCLTAIKGKGKVH